MEVFMKNKKSSIIIGSAAAILIGSTVFGTVAGLASKVKYRGVNPTQGVISQLGLIDSVAFKPSVASFTSDYQSVKNALLNGKTFNGTSSAFADFASKFDFLTNNGRTVLNIPKKYQVVIKDFVAEDDKKRFRLSFYLKETLPDGNIAQSASKFIYLLPVDAPKAALAQFSYIVDNNLANLVQYPLTNFSSTSVKPLALTRASDFAKKLNEFKTEEELISYLNQFFDIEALKANIRLQARDFSFAKGNLTEPFIYSFVRNPQNEKEYASQINAGLKTVRLYVKTEFRQQAKSALKDYKNKDESFITSIDLKTSDNKTLFADENDLRTQLDVNLLDIADYYSVGNNSQLQKLPESLDSLKARDEARRFSADKTLAKYSLYSYDALSFYSQMQELLTKPELIKELINASLVRGLTFSFGKYDLLFDDLSQHLDYDFLMTAAKVKQNSVSKKLFIEIPVKIVLKSSIFGDSGAQVKPVLEKVVSFKLDNFRDVTIEKAFGVLYPEVYEELKKAKEDQAKALAAGKKPNSQQAQDLQNQEDEEEEIDFANPQNSPIQYQAVEQNLQSSPLGQSAKNPYKIAANQDKYLLAKSEIDELIKEKNYAKLAMLISDPLTYNVQLRLKDQLFNNNIQIPSEQDIAKANFVLDDTDTNLYSQIYSSFSAVFPNKQSLYGYYRYLLSLNPKDTISQLVKLGQKIGLEFTNWENLPNDFNLDDLKNVKIKTPFSKNTAKASAGQSQFKLRLLDFNNYGTETNSSSESFPIFLPARIQVPSSGMIEWNDESQSNSNWINELVSQLKGKNLSNREQLQNLPMLVAQKIFPNSNKGTGAAQFQQIILKELQRNINQKDTIKFSLGKRESFFNDKAFAAIDNLQDLLFAFYSSAALANNWNNYQQSGAKPAIVFEKSEVPLLPEKKEDKLNDNVYALKFHYAIGFDDNAGKFNPDVIKSSSRTIYLQVSGASLEQVRVKRELNEALANAPLGLQSFSLDPEKFGVFQNLANSLVEKTKTAVIKQDEEKPKDDTTIWVHDPIRKPEMPQIESAPEQDWFEGKLTNSLTPNENQNSEKPKPQNVNVSTFGSGLVSPFFATEFQEEKALGGKTTDTQASQSENVDKEAKILKQKLAILLGSEFIQYYQQTDANVEFEIVSVSRINETSFKVEFKLAKNINENNTTNKVLSDESITLLISTTIEEAPEFAAEPKVFNTTWDKVYNPANPLAATTKFSLEFKEKIPLDANGRVKSEWLAKIPLVIHQQVLNLTPLVQTTKEVELQQGKILANVIRKEKERQAIEVATKYAILNPLTRIHRLSLNNQANPETNIKIKNINVVNGTKLEFDLWTNNLKRLINAPITFGNYNPFLIWNSNKALYEKVKEQFVKGINPQVQSADFNISLISIKENGKKQNEKYLMIKPKYIVERAVGVPWTTGYDNYSGKQNEITITKPSKQSNNKGTADFIDALALRNTEYANKWGLSVKIFDPANELASIKDSSARKGEEKLLASYDLYKSYEANEKQKIAKGWTNIHPDQQPLQGNKQELPDNYLNLILNQPWRVTLYNSSDFVTNLFRKPDSRSKLKNVIARQINNNYASWGTAYLTFWYPKEVIAAQPNIISANIDQVLIKDYKEISENKKLIAPNITRWWPNIQNSKELFLLPTFNRNQQQSSTSSSNSNTPQWTKIKQGFTLQALKSRFNRKSRTFVLTTNAPIPLTKYDVYLKKGDWRLVFQNDENQLAMLRVDQQQQNDKNDKNKWIKFKVTIPREMFTSNIRFVGVLQVTSQRMLWLPVINSSVIYDFYAGTGDSSDPKNISTFDKVKTIALTNNAFDNVFKEFNISKKVVE
ncbi:cell surface protein [Mycoplasma flocculare]|nr:cell surface protein [Mesomycoplasma flocculare]